LGFTPSLKKWSYPQKGVLPDYVYYGVLIKTLKSTFLFQILEIKSSEKPQKTPIFGVFGELKGFE
jgi:hypothetical protein